MKVELVKRLLKSRMKLCQQEMQTRADCADYAGAAAFKEKVGVLESAIIDIEYAEEIEKHSGEQSA